MMLLMEACIEIKGKPCGDSLVQLPLYHISTQMVKIEESGQITAQRVKRAQVLWCGLSIGG